MRTITQAVFVVFFFIDLPTDFGAVGFKGKLVGKGIYADSAFIKSS